jgi:hypothetical protein
MFTWLYVCLLILGVHSSNIELCNECDTPVTVDVTDPSYFISYTLCTFDTTLSVTYTNPSVSTSDWIMIGLTCDDRCPDIPQIGEGFLCAVNGTQGYYEVDNGNELGEFVAEKIDIHHTECMWDSLSNQLQVHLHRFMPNAWIRNTTVTYYISTPQLALMYPIPIVYP